MTHWDRSDLVQEYVGPLASHSLCILSQYQQNWYQNHGEFSASLHLVLLSQQVHLLLLVCAHLLFCAQLTQLFSKFRELVHVHPASRRCHTIGCRRHENERLYGGGKFDMNFSNPRAIQWLEKKIVQQWREEKRGFRNGVWSLKGQGGLIPTSMISERHKLRMLCEGL